MFLSVVLGHALGCFCHSYGRFLGIISLPTVYHTLLRAQGCSSCSAGMIVSAAAAGFPFPARAGGSRRSHIPSSPHQRHGPEGWDGLPAPSPSQNQLFQGFKGTQPCAQHRSGVLLLGSAGLAGSAPRCDVAAGLGCSCWAAEQMWCFALFPQVLHPAFPCHRYYLLFSKG